jgi:SAM-dependent methyltransferase
MPWRKYLLIPQLSLYALAAPRNQARAWERYWSGVRSTGAAGEVLWDADQLVEAETVAEQLRVHADLTLPMVDLGCGNGRQSRALTLLSSRVLGIDASAAAIARARLEAADSPEHYVERARLEAADSPEHYVDALGAWSTLSHACGCRARTDRRRKTLTFASARCRSGDEAFV